MTISLTKDYHRRPKSIWLQHGYFDAFNSTQKWTAQLKREMGFKICHNKMSRGERETTIFASIVQGSANGLASTARSEEVDIETVSKFSQQPASSRVESGRRGGVKLNASRHTAPRANLFFHRVSFGDSWEVVFVVVVFVAVARVTRSSRVSPVARWCDGSPGFNLANVLPRGDEDPPPPSPRKF
jgi:hypothetical protein